MIHEEGGLLTGTDRRYWRRRVNRHVHKERRLRRLVEWSLVLVLNLGIVGILAYSARKAFEHARTSAEFALSAIRLEGLERCSGESVRARLGELEGRNILGLDLEEIARTIREEPWVLDCSVKRILPRALRVSITEREPAALALLGGTPRVVDRTGFVVGPAGADLAEDLPVLTGLDQLAREARDVALRDGVTALERLKATAGSWVEEISELDLSLADRIEVTTIQPGPKVLLDPKKAERNLNDYLALGQQILRRVGRVEYVDLRWSDRIAVMPERNPLQPGGR